MRSPSSSTRQAGACHDRAHHAARARSSQIEPGIRFAGQVGEQATMFFYDPSGNALEFKTFRDPSRLFAKQAPGPA